MLRVSPFWFKRQNPAAAIPQRNITRVQVQTPGDATTTDIVGLFELDDNKTNLDPNALGLYGSWTGTPEAYGSHLGVLSDNGFSKYLDGVGIQKNDWGVGTLDTYYNVNGITFSWIQRVEPATGARFLQYWQADNEYIDVYFLDADTIRITAILGSGTAQSDDALLADHDIDDGRFHHFLVSFNPGGDRIARLYINGVLAAETAAVTGVAVFGDEVVNIRRGIGFGCSYTATDADNSGDVDHCTILLGSFTPIATGLDGRMTHHGIFMRYYGGQMYYNGSAVIPEGNVLYGVDEVFYGNEAAVYPDGSIFQFTSGVPHWVAYD